VRGYRDLRELRTITAVAAPSSGTAIARRTPEPDSMHRLARFCPPAALAALLACGSGDSPEQQIRALVSSAQTAANEQDAGALRELVAESYTDMRGLKKADIDRMIGLHLLRGRPYVLAHVQELALLEDGRAQVSVLAGMARVPVGGFDELRRTSADVFVFDLDLLDAGDGTWQVASARWRLARPDDLSL
jgi:hypothetical protein